MQKLPFKCHPMYFWHICKKGKGLHTPLECKQGAYIPFSQSSQHHNTTVSSCKKCITSGAGTRDWTGWWTPI